MDEALHILLQHTYIHSSTVSSLLNTGTQVFHVTDHEVKSMTGPVLGKREVGTRWAEQNGRQGASRERAVAT